VKGRESRVAAAIAALGLASGALLGCGDDSGKGPASGPGSTSPTAALTEAAPLPGDPGVTVVNVIQACREQAGERLRSFVAVAVSEEELQALFARGRDVRLVSQTPPEIDGERATVQVRLEIQREGRMDVVDRTWELVPAADGVWRLTRLPNCF